MLDVQGVVKIFDPGHITGIAKQHRAVPVHGVVYHRPAGPGRVEALGKGAVQCRFFIRAAKQLQKDVAMVVVGEKIEADIAPVLNEMVLCPGVGV